MKGPCIYVMTVGFSLPVKSFSFDTDNARSDQDHVICKYIIKCLSKLTQTMINQPINGFKAICASSSCLDTSGSNCSM